VNRTILVKGLALATVLLALSISTPRAEKIIHHGVIADSEGNVFDCLSCHDGLVATEIKLSTKIGNYFCNHPVNRDYPPAGKIDAYKPEEQVTSAGIKLVNGQVSCISCHNLNNREKYQLAVPLDNSNLCFSCHII